jgi:hypothetical protein
MTCSRITRNHASYDCATCGYCEWHCQCQTSQPGTVNAPMGTTREPAVIELSGNPGESRSLFIPLKTEYFEAFANGSKDTEYRPYGARWNERSCAIGRAVVLSKGYGKQERLEGVIVGFQKRFLNTVDWIDCYGMPGTAACIEIKVTKDQP